jgi:hypothetical protein
MLQLTRREQILAASLLLAFLLGMGIKHYRERASIPPFSAPIIHK